MMLEKLIVNPPLPPLVDFPKPKVRNFTLISVAFAIGSCLGLLSKLLLSSGSTTLFYFLNTIALFRPSGFLLTLAGFESILFFQVTGQILTAAVIGWKIISVSLGPLKLYRRAGKWRFSSNKFIVSHFVTSVPRSANSPGWRLTISLGIVPLLLVAGAAISLVAFAHVSGHAWLQNYFAAAALFGLSVALFSFVPNSRSAPVWNPARYCFALLTRDPEVQNRVVSLRLLGLAQQKERPSDYPSDLIVAAAQPTRNASSAAMRASVIACWCLDRGDLLSAGAWFDRLAELAQLCGTDIKNVALASSSCFDVAWKGDFQSAILKLKEVNAEKLPSNVSRLSTQAVLHILNGDDRAAEATITLAEADCSGPLGEYSLKTLTRFRAIARDIRAS